MRIDRSNLKNRGKGINCSDDVLLNGHWYHVMATTPRAIILRLLVSYLTDHPNYEAKKRALLKLG